MPEKIIKIFVLIILAVVFMTGCGREPEKESALDKGFMPGMNRIKVGIVLAPPGKGDMGVNDAALAGLKKAEEQLDIEIEVMEPKELVNDRESLKYLAENNFDLVIAVGSQMQKVLSELVPQFTDIKFAIIDGTVEAPNVLNLSFATEDGSFLAGAAAASLTSTGYVGFIGGNQMEQEPGYENGFARGVQYVNMTEGKQVKVLVTYAGVTPDALKNPERGKTLALQQYRAGADIIYHNAGQTGMGIFQAAAEVKKWAIGSDIKSAGAAPGNVYGSTVKKTEKAVFDILKSLAENKFQTGTRVYGLKEGGVAFQAGPSVAPEVTAKLNLMAGQVARNQVVISKIGIPEGLKIIRLNVPVDRNRPQAPETEESIQKAYPGTPGAMAEKAPINQVRTNNAQSSRDTTHPARGPGSQ